MRSTISREVEKEIAEVNDQFKLDKIFQQITYLAFSLDFKSSFSRSERDLVIKTLRDYNEKNGKVNNDFLTYLEKIVDSFSSAGLDLYIDDIYELYEGEMLNHKGISITLIHHYGKRYLIALHDNKQEEIKLLGSKVAKIKKSSNRHESPELTLFLEMGESNFMPPLVTNTKIIYLQKRIC